MKFSSVNELDCFQFHDAEITDIKIFGDKMIWSVSAMNAMTTNTQNDNSKDMCIESASITFENISIKKLMFGAYKIYDSDNNLIKSVEEISAMPDKYIDILAESTKGYCFIYGMDELKKVSNKNYQVCFNIDGNVGSYYLTFTFSSVIVEWDVYSGEAWYEHPKWGKDISD